MKITLLFMTLALFLNLLNAIYGTIHLSDGKIFQGKIELNRSLYFRDIFLERGVNIPIEQVYCIEPLLDGLEPYKNWENDYPQSIERSFILGIHTWQGESYWGKLNLQISIILENKKKCRFLLPKKQVIWNKETVDKTAYITQILFQPTEDSIKNIPSSAQNASDFLQNLSNASPKFLSLCGNLDPIGVFQKIYALHDSTGIMFPGIVSSDGKFYYIPRIMPGNYHLFLVTKKEIVFGLGMPARKNLMDRTTYPEDLLSSWISEKSSAHLTRTFLYAIGRHSQTYCLLTEETLTKESNYRQYWLWNCQYLKNHWNMKHSHLLHIQPLKNSEDTIFNLLYDEKLESIYVQGTGLQQWNYSAD